MQQKLPLYKSEDKKVPVRPIGGGSIVGLAGGLMFSLGSYVEARTLCQTNVCELDNYAFWLAPLFLGFLIGWSIHRLVILLALRLKNR